MQSNIYIYIYIYADPGITNDMPGFPVKTGTSWPPGAAMHLNHLHIAHKPHTTFYRLLIDSTQSFTTFGADLTLILVSIQKKDNLDAATHQLQVSAPGVALTGIRRAPTDARPSSPLLLPPLLDHGWDHPLLPYPPGRAPPSPLHDRQQFAPRPPPLARAPLDAHHQQCAPLSLLPFLPRCARTSSAPHSLLPALFPAPFPALLPVLPCSPAVPGSRPPCLLSSACVPSPSPL